MSLHEQLEQEFLEMVTGAGLPAPDELLRQDVLGTGGFPDLFAEAG
jgi:hypothetical protein